MNRDFHCVRFRYLRNLNDMNQLDHFFSDDLARSSR